MHFNLTGPYTGVRHVTSLKEFSPRLSLFTTYFKDGLPRLSHTTDSPRLDFADSSYHLFRDYRSERLEDERFSLSHATMELPRCAALVIESQTLNSKCSSILQLPGGTTIQLGDQWWSVEGDNGFTWLYAHYPVASFTHANAHLRTWHPEMAEYGASEGRFDLPKAAA